MALKPPAGREARLEFYRDKTEEFLPGRLDIEDLGDLALHAHAMDTLVHDCALEEVEAMVHFVMICVQNTQIRQDQLKKHYLRFLRSKQEVLYALGIDLLIPAAGTMYQRVEAVEA